MDPVSVLIIAIEVSIGLTGFAGIVVAFQFQKNPPVLRREILGLTLLVQNGLVSAFFLRLFHLSWKVSTSLWQRYGKSPAG